MTTPKRTLCMTGEIEADEFYNPYQFKGIQTVESQTKVTSSLFTVKMWLLAPQQPTTIFAFGEDLPPRYLDGPLTINYTGHNTKGTWEGVCEGGCIRIDTGGLPLLCWV